MQYKLATSTWDKKKLRPFKGCDSDIYSNVEVWSNMS